MATLTPGTPVIKTETCNKPECYEIGTKRCSGCFKAVYCSGECQKEDWKLHKLLCPYMKEEDKLKEFSDVAIIILKIKDISDQQKGPAGEIRILEYALSFAELQYGERSMEVISNGTRMHSWNSTIHLYDLCFTLGKICFAASTFDNVNGIKDYCHKSIYYYKKALGLLEPYLAEFKSKEKSSEDNIANQSKVFMICQNLSFTHHALGGLNHILHTYDEAGEHFTKALAFAKLLSPGELRMKLSVAALESYGDNLFQQSKYTEARAVYEEWYNLTAVAYYPNHPMVLEAAEWLIKILVVLEEYYDAERYARICYECLTRPVDNEDEKIGNAADSLSTVTFKLILRGQTAECGNIVEAEMLARKALRILQRIHGSRWKTLNALTTLSQILLFKGNCNTERQELLEQILTIDTQTDGVNSRNVAIANGSLAAHHHNVFLELPKSDANYEKNKKKAAKYCKEAIRISTKVVGSTHRETISYKKTLSEILGKTKLVA